MDYFKDPYTQITYWLSNCNLALGYEIIIQLMILKIFFRAVIL